MHKIRHRRAPGSREARPEDKLHVPATHDLDGRLDDPDAKGSTRPGSLNAKGMVAGDFSDANGLTHGFVWTK